MVVLDSRPGGKLGTRSTAAANIKQRPLIRFRALEKVRTRPPSLVQVCLKRVAQNFLTFDNAVLQQKLNRKQFEDVYAMLDLDMSLPHAATRIGDENYWKRRTQRKYRNAQVEKHGMSWKQTFLELELQDALERVPITVESNDPEMLMLKQQVVQSRLHIFQLKIGQLPSHIDLSFVFDSLPALCSFTITYGNRRLGMDYERAMFGMKITDARNLARNIRVSQTLVSLALPCNMIDDELVKVLMGGLSYGVMLTSLDLSHNKIGDRGARRLASLLDPQFCLQTLDLSDNQIHANGCMHLGAHLAENVTCEVVNLRLNRCEDNGVSHLFQDLCDNHYLRTLNISCNELTERCLPYMSTLFQTNSTLEELDLGANPLHKVEEEGGPGAGVTAAAATMDPRSANPAWASGTRRALTATLDATNLGPGADVTTLAEDSADAQAMATVILEDGLGGISLASHLGQFAQSVVQSTSLKRLDIRQCGIPPELAERISTAVKHRELRSKNIPVEAYEMSKIKPVDEEPIDEEGIEDLAEVADGDEAEGEEGAAGEDGGEAAEGEKAEGDEKTE
mmetsp:Transcript_69935/g.138501  ORF Transcript_69935/g.138501 Transcript_69935/m.138501 type:complete len:565 (+) Transcript_69935:15-1709(+)